MRALYAKGVQGLEKELILLKIQMMKRIYLVLFILVFNFHLNAQITISGHSHNDYAQKYPFKTAFNTKMGSIEADVHFLNGNLYVAHDKEHIKQSRTLEKLYLKPLEEAIKTGKAYPLVLLIDIKSQADSTLDAVVKQIAQHSAFFNGDSPVKFVISGNRPKPERWIYYPFFIQFDGRPTETYTDEQWQRIGMVSDNFEKYVTTKGQKDIDSITADKLKSVIENTHKQGKKMRFWATPDTKNVWKTLAEMGVDFINTDSPKALSKFLDN